MKSTHNSFSNAGNGYFQGYQEYPHPKQFLQVPEASFTNAKFQVSHFPTVWRGLASHWPAVEKWTFRYLTKIGAKHPVKLVVGNRELGDTRFVDSTFEECVAGFIASTFPWGDEKEAVHLKEFDLLKEFPILKQDFKAKKLFPKHHIVSNSAWIGPKGAHTGLHFDLLDNIAVLVQGLKRFYLAPPGFVQAHGALSNKYDRWARLAKESIHELAERKSPTDLLFYVDLFPGDVLYIPKGWWHEVINIEPSILLSGFFGHWKSVVQLWMTTGMKQFVHDINCFTCDRNCTCHCAG
ncbi:MAG: cupin-like domain-containing protein [Burkholderiaceae bacterium]